MFKYDEPRCLICNPLIYQNTTSKFEQEVRDAVSFAYGPKFDIIYGQSINRSTITSIDGHERELDIIVMDKKTKALVLAVEANGIFYHSYKQKPSGYHLDKTIACENIGLNLLHIWEDEWINNRDEITHLLTLFAFNEADDLVKKYEKSEKLYLPRDKFNKVFKLNSWKLDAELPPKIVMRRENAAKKPIAVEDCGILVYSKI